MSYLFFCYLRQDTCLIPNSGMCCSNKSQHFFLYDAEVNNGFLMKVVMWSMLGNGTKPSLSYRQKYGNGSTYSKKRILENVGIRRYSEGHLKESDIITGSSSAEPFSPWLGMTSPLTMLFVSCCPQGSVT